MLRKLDKKERMRLMRFVCSFAWVDLEVQAAEKKFVHKMATRLGLSADEKEQVEEWLKMPPPIDDVDPAEIPTAHRQAFVDAVADTIKADGIISPEEDEMFQLFVQLVQPPAKGKSGSKR